MLSAQQQYWNLIGLPGTLVENTRAIIGDKIPSTLTNSDVEDNERLAASKGIVHSLEKVFMDITIKKGKALNNNLKENSANCNEFTPKKTDHQYDVCRKCN